MMLFFFNSIVCAHISCFLCRRCSVVVLIGRLNVQVELLTDDAFVDREYFLVGGFKVGGRVI